MENTEVDHDFIKIEINACLCHFWKLIFMTFDKISLQFSNWRTLIMIMVMKIVYCVIKITMMITKNSSPVTLMTA